LFELLLLAVLLFVSTNIDDLFVLLAFLSDRRIGAKSVVAGQFFGIATLYAASVGCVLAARTVPEKYIGLLGVAPILLGGMRLWTLIRHKPGAEEFFEPKLSASSALAVALVTIANGGDNLTVYVPAFSAHSGMQIAIFGFVFLLLTGVWLAVAYYLTRHPRLGPPVRRAGNIFAPLVLIALGVVILKESGAGRMLLDMLNR
jgi:cadmium resistance protein CadD (predicted permease)